MENNNELIHWGVRGMKWGLRRYQNSDGTLTEAGKKRYNKELEKIRTEKKVAKQKLETQAKLEKLDAKRREIDELNSKISNASIKDRITGRFKKKAEEAERKKQADEEKRKKQAEEAERKKKSDEEKRKKKDEEAEKNDKQEKPKEKKLKDMNDDELQAKINRLNLEKRYAELTSNPSKAEKTKGWVSEALSSAASDLGKQAIKHVGAKLINRAFDEEAVYANNKKK